MTPDKANALREAAERATPGPWNVAAETVIVSTADWPMPDGPSWHDWGPDAEPPSRFIAETRTAEDEGEANAAYIALADPPTILDLLAERERLRGALEDAAETLASAFIETRDERYVDARDAARQALEATDDQT